MRATTPRTPTEIEVIRLRGLDLGVAAGHHHDRPVAAEHVVDQLDAPLLPDVERNQHVGERDRVAQRQYADALRQLAGVGDGDLARPAAG